MGEKNGLDYLHRLFKERLGEWDSSKKWYRNRYYQYQASTVVLSALITVISGLKISGLPEGRAEMIASDLVLILGAVVTVFAAFGAFFSPQESWQLNAEFYCRLKALETELYFAEQKEDFEGRKCLLIERMFADYQTIMAEYNDRWLKVRQKGK